MKEKKDSVNKKAKKSKEKKVNSSEEKIDKKNDETAILENMNNKADSTEEKTSDEIDSLEQELQSLKSEKEELKDSLLRKAAEFENFKRRMESDQFNLIKYAAESLILSILPVYDDLGRSLNHIDEANNLESLKKGLSLVYDKFTKTLEEQGVKKIESKGTKFDFNLHEALMQQHAEGVEPHTVIEEIEPGYMFKDKVLKHAKVIVSQEISDNDIETSDTNKENEKSKNDNE